MWKPSPKKKLQLGGGYENFEAKDKGGSLTVTARVSSGASRYAMPSIPELVYAALLYPDNERPENPPSEKFVGGVPSGDKFVFSFQRPDETDGITFTLEVFAFVKADAISEDGTKNFSINNVFLSGCEHGLTIGDDTDEIKVTDPIALSSSEPETVNLKIKVPDGCSLEITDTTHFTVEGTLPNFMLVQNGTGIPAGSYPVTFTVKKGDEIIHVFSEYINVINGLCTDTWWNGSVSSAVKDVAQSLSKTLYVRGADGWYDKTTPYNDGETAKASDDNLGSFASPFATIQKAIDKIIAMNDGESEYTIKIDGTLTVDVENMARIAPDTNLNLTIESLSSDTNAILDAANSGRVMCITSSEEGISTVTLKNIHITSGYFDGFGGGIYVGGGSLAMVDCKITECKAQSGGGIYNNGGKLELTNVNITGGNDLATPDANVGGGIYNVSGTLTMTGGSISGCNAGATDSGRGGGGICNGGTFSLSGVTISDCSAGAYGGGILTGGTSAENIVKDCTITDCKIQDTTVNNCGGGICVYTGSLTVEGGTISECVANRSVSGIGGGVFIRSGASAEIKGCTITGCKAMNGGGINNELASTEIEGCTITNCTAIHNGGGIYNEVSDDTVTTKITNCTITGCKAGGTTSTSGGGGIYNASGSLELTGVTIIGGNDTGNPDARYGGGLFVNDGTLTMSGGEISDCTATASGGGVYIGSSGSFKMSGTAKIADCKTTSTSSATGGGGIYSLGTLTVIGGTISDCIAGRSGGGIYAYGGTVKCSSGVAFSNCETTGTGSVGSGGGMCINSGVTADVSDCTFTSCTAKASGGGIWNAGTLTVINTSFTTCTADNKGGGICNDGGTVTPTGITYTGCTAPTDSDKSGF